MIELITSDTIIREEIIPELAKFDVLGLDIECRGTNPRESEMLTIQLSSQSDTWVFDTRRVNLAPVFELLKQTNPLIIGHNLKFDISFLQYNYGYVPSRIFDTMIAYGIINNGIENPFVSLKHLVELYSDQTLNKELRDSFRYTYADLTDEQVRYAARDVEVLWSVFDAELEQLNRDDLIETAKLEFDIIPVVVDMELMGVKLDKDKWVEAAARLAREASNIEKYIVEIVGGQVLQSSFLDTPAYNVNPRSPKQMLEAFRKLGFNIENTQADTLSKIEHPLAQALTKYRTKSKLASTYGVNFLDKIESDGRIHAEFNQQGTVSGRFACSKPNLENIPADPFYRSCFVAEDGSMLITADYDQVELKIAAIMSNEIAMLEEYKKFGSDLHRLTASRILRIPMEEVQEDQRDNVGKSCNFGVMYGISEYGLLRRFGISLDEGRFLIDGFGKAYPTLTSYMLEQGQLALRDGYNTTKIGRRRYYELPSLGSREYGKNIARIRREAANQRIQGTGADIMKQAMVNVHNQAVCYSAHIVNTVHDELVVECPIKYTSKLLPIVREQMELAGRQIMGDALEWSVSIGVGGSWKKV